MKILGYFSGIRLFQALWKSPIPPFRVTPLFPPGTFCCFSRGIFFLPGRFFLPKDILGQIRISGGEAGNVPLEMALGSLPTLTKFHGFPFFFLGLKGRKVPKSLLLPPQWIYGRGESWDMLGEENPFPTCSSGSKEPTPNPGKSETWKI